MSIQLYEDLNNKPPLDEATLEHFGVKGMKWGVRKAKEHHARSKALNTANPNYSSSNRKKDSVVLGAYASKKINQRMNKGESYESARKTERKKAFRRTAIGGVAVAGFLVTELAVTELRTNPELQAVLMEGAAEAGRIFANSKGVDSPNAITGLTRAAAKGGVHKITTMR